MNTTTTSNAPRFILNFANKTIVGSKASFAKAGKGFGPVYDELVALMAKHPNFGIEEKAPKQPPKTKQSYKGMDIPFMRDFLVANNDSTTLKTLNDAIAFAKSAGMSIYPLAKRVFFDTYDCFDYANAKQVVAEYRHQMTLARADEMATKRATALIDEDGSQVA